MVWLNWSRFIDMPNHYLSMQFQFVFPVTVWYSQLDLSEQSSQSIRCDSVIRKQVTETTNGVFLENNLQTYQFMSNWDYSSAFLNSIFSTLAVSYPTIFLVNTQVEKFSDPWNENLLRALRHFCLAVKVIQTIELVSEEHSLIILK